MLGKRWLVKTSVTYIVVEFANSYLFFSYKLIIELYMWGYKLLCKLDVLGSGSTYCSIWVYKELDHLGVAKIDRI